MFLMKKSTFNLSGDKELKILVNNQLVTITPNNLITV